MRILLFSNLVLPDSCANATRVMNFAKLLREAGHEIELLGVCYDQKKALEGVCDNIPYGMLRAAPYFGIHAGKRIVLLKKDIDAFLDDRRTYDAILLSNVYYDYADVFLRYAKKTGAKIAVNAVEWYEKNNGLFAGLTGKLNFVKNRIALRYLHKKMGNIIAISSLLDDYYKVRGCNTVTIPTMVDMEEYADVSATEKEPGTVVRVAYAGSPARKDYVINAIFALPLLSDEERSRLQLHFYGPDTKLLKMLGLSEEFLNTYRDNIVCHGRIPYAEVKSKIADADFTVLLRPNKRYANAGFPTKVGESMACGTPVIANITSDLGKYILDGKTGIVCRDETPEACADGFRRALSMTAEERNAMRNWAKDMAANSFDYKNYSARINNFLVATNKEITT